VHIAIYIALDYSRQSPTAVQGSDHVPELVCVLGTPYYYEIYGAIMRKLATVRRVAQVLPIEGADLIELAVVDGWQCVIKKDSFKAGDLCIYCEIDTVLPISANYEFLRKGCYIQRDWLQTPNGEGFRLRTLRLRKQVSQGLLLTLDTISRSLSVGQDVTDILGIVKWEPPVAANLAGQVRGNFPSYIPKTDQERVQNIMSKVFSSEYLAHTWEATLKLDGSSCTFFHKDGEVGVCSRSVNLKTDQLGNTFVDMFHKLHIPELLPQHGNIAIQGELMGNKIQGNREGFHTFKYYVYDVWDIDSQCYLKKGARDEIISHMGLQSVPLLDVGTLGELRCITIQDMLAYVERPSINHPVAEGIVFKCMSQEDNVSPYSFKCISNTYLLREK